MMIVSKDQTLPGPAEEHQEPREGLTPDGAEAVAASVRKLAEKVRRACSSLPSVTPDGGSDCPFAEDLYAQKQESWDELADRVADLHAVLSEVDRQIARGRTNLMRILEGERRVSLPEAAAELNRAAQLQSAESARWRGARSTVESALRAANAVLEHGELRRFPLGEPRRDPGYGIPLQMPGRPPRSAGRSDTGRGEALSRETSELLAHGPSRRWAQ